MTEPEETDEALEERATMLMYEAEGFRTQMRGLQGGIERHEKELEARRDEIKKLRVEVNDAAAYRIDAELKARVLKGDEDAKKELAEIVAKLKDEVKTMKEQLASEEQTLQQLKQANDKNERIIDRLQDDRMTLDRDYKKKVEDETALVNEGKRMTEELAKITGENNELQGKVSESMMSREKAVELTRTAEQINLDSSFRSKFPTIPRSEYLVDWFGCATVANPGWVYVGTHYIAWEPAVNPLMNRVVIPIECIRRLNKVQSSNVLNAMMFEVFVDNAKPPTTKLLDGSVLSSVLSIPLQKHYRFRSANWQELFCTVARQAQMLPHKLTISINGKDDYGLQYGVMPSQKD